MPGMHRGRHGFVLAAMVCLMAAGVSAAEISSPQPQTLTTIAAVRDISSEKAATRIPVELQAVVTYYDANTAMLVVHDGTGGIFVGTSPHLPITAGSTVQISGRTHADFTNDVRDASVREISRGSRPPPRVIPLNQLLSGHADCEYVTVTGQVRTAFLFKDDKSLRLKIRLDVQGKTVDFEVLEFPEALDIDALLGSTVRIRGVAVGNSNEQFQLIGIFVEVQSLADVEIVTAGTNPYLLPARPIAQVLSYDLNKEMGIRAHVMGYVTYVQPGRLLILQHGKAALAIGTSQQTNVALGDAVDATGFPAFGEDGAVLEDANYKVADKHEVASLLVPAFPIDDSNATGGVLGSRLVSIEAKLSTISATSAKYTLALSTGDLIFSAILKNAVIPPELLRLREGTVVRVTGIYSIDEAGRGNNIEGFRILMRTPQDITVLQRPSWWSAQRLIYLLGSLAAAIAVTFTWIAALKRRLAAQSRRMLQTQVEEVERERMFGLLQETRNRVLEGISRREPLGAILGLVAQLPEQQVPALRCIIHRITEEGQLALVKESSAAVDESLELAEEDLGPQPGRQLGPDQRMDRATDQRTSHRVSRRTAPPLWVQVARSGQPAAEVGSRSWPILSAKGAVAGTVTALNCSSVPQDLLSSLFEMATQLAALAIDNRALYDSLSHRSQHDSLTGLPNLNHLNERLDAAVQAARISGECLAIAYIDLNKFKLVNDEYGHEVGDLFLQSAAQRFRACLREGDMLGRVGGDEFVGFFPGISSRAEADEIGRRISEALTEPLLLSEGKSLPCSASIGIALFPEDGETHEELRRHADEAMYTVKLRTSAGDAGRSGKQVSIADLRSAIDSQRLRAHYQPIFGIDGSLFGFEALMRLADHNGGLIQPSDFIPIAEDSGLILPMGQWILRKACEQAKLWHREENGCALTMSVNVSARQFAHGGFVRDVCSVIEETQFPPALLLLELTESTILRDLTDTMAQMHQLRRLGVRIALDDFGTGHSSLSVLQHLPVDVLKVDRSFMRSMNDAAKGRQVVESIFSLAASVGAQTIAEGVEYAPQVDALRMLGCMAVQGFGFGKPLSAEDTQPQLKEWLTTSPSLKGRLIGNGEAAGVGEISRGLALMPVFKSPGRERIAVAAS